MRRSTARREEGGLANERVLPHVENVTIVFLREDNEEVPLQEPQVPPEPQEPQVPQVPLRSHSPFVEEDMTNAELRASLMNFTQLMTAQAHVVNNNFVAQDNQRYSPQPNFCTPASRIRNFIRMNPPTFHGTNVD